MPADEQSPPWLQPEQPQDGESALNMRIILRAKKKSATSTIIPTMIVSVMVFLERRLVDPQVGQKLDSDVENQCQVKGSGKNEGYFKLSVNIWDYGVLRGLGKFVFADAICRLFVEVVNHFHLCSYAELNVEGVC
ncbi:hypothetical protein [Pseudodesulfovibrio sp.]|uniref:hypothetical protein n=1 Tax=unclassified Pseudodesulfovibrio TaxID=2661612 RepID=UPI003B00B1F6